MLNLLISVVAVLLMAVALVTVPLGLPGVWIMLVILGVGALFGVVSWGLWAGLLCVTLVAEVAEYLILKRVGTRYGASNRAFWGAVVGGLVGVVVGLPIPIVGSLLAVFVGTFAGAGLVTLLESRSLQDASRVGVGVVIGRSFAAALKVGVGVVILLIGGGSLFLN